MNLSDRTSSSTHSADSAHPLSTQSSIPANTAGTPTSTPTDSNQEHFLGTTDAPDARVPGPRAPSFFIRLAPPTYTRVLLVANVVAFVVMIVYGYLAYSTLDGTQDMRVLRDLGAKVNPLIASGEVWRLFTAMFLHIGVIHLLVNLWALNVLGPMVEGYFGHRRFLIIYLLGGLLGSLASYAFSPVPSAGASGAIFGLAGATTVYFLRYRDYFGRRGRAILQNMVVIIGINLFFGLASQGIDNWGHMGGLVGGAILAWGLLPLYERPQVMRLESQAMQEERRLGAETVWALLYVSLLLAGLLLATDRWLGNA